MKKMTHAIEGEAFLRATHTQSELVNESSKNNLEFIFFQYSHIVLITCSN